MIKNLRDFGFGKASMEKVIQEEITELIDMIRQEEMVGKPIRTRGMFNAGDIINKILNSWLSSPVSRTDTET